MINPAQQLLLQLINTYGVTITHDVQLLEIHLRRSAQGEYKREIFLWVQAAKDGIVELLQKHKDKPLNLLAQKLAKKMHDDCGTDLQAASWAVESWMLALGMIKDSGSLQLQGVLRVNEPNSLGVVQPEWASGMGRDDMGLYMDVPIMTVVQRFRWIKAGTFLMGSPKTEVNHFHDESQFEVTLSKGFWMADTACSQALWRAVMGKNPASFRGTESNPVERVSWYDVQSFLGSLKALIPGMNVKLPTGAQWEYACRAGTLTPFSFGENITTSQVNYDGTKPYANAEKSIFRNKTVPIKSLPPNQWGLYEMHGNVWEWCQDWYGYYPSQPSVDPLGPKLGSMRLIRGGSWFRGARGTRSANRSCEEPHASNYQIGFRFIISKG